MACCWNTGIKGIHKKSNLSGWSASRPMLEPGIPRTQSTNALLGCPVSEVQQVWHWNSSKVQSSWRVCAHDGDFSWVKDEGDDCSCGGLMCTLRGEGAPGFLTSPIVKHVHSNISQHANGLYLFCSIFCALQSESWAIGGGMNIWCSLCYHTVLMKHGDITIGTTDIDV
jgi:hypothetical protein